MRSFEDIEARIDYLGDADDAADAVGERLARLADGAQVLAVTHSPQVAARGHHHLRVTKNDSHKGGRCTVARVEKLSPEERREETARLPAASEITNEAHPPADRLMERAPARGMSG